MSDPRRSIPAVEALLSSRAFGPLIRDAGRTRVADALRAVQAEVRSGVVTGAEGAVSAPGSLDDPTTPEWYAERVRDRVERENRRSLRRVINATGVVLHTNLGRAPLAEAARQAVLEAMGYATLEYDLDSGTRGSRHDHCVALLRDLTGAEDALVVNNNAAAVLLVLNALAEGRAAIVSRGELVEIGGSFRVPEIMARSGARMHEVGSTNRTHIEDYEAAVGPDTGIVLKVHRSNFRVEGFTAEVSAAELSELARRSDISLVHDLGSGALLDLSPFGLPHEPTAREALAHADVVTMSGDKLLGGPQAGIVLGRAALIEWIRGNPIARAVRPDKLTLAALEATLGLYRDPDKAVRDVPTLRMLAAPPEELRQRAEALAERLAAVDVAAETAEAVSAVGGGAYPGVELPTTVVRLGDGRDPDAVVRVLRHTEPPVVARVQEGRVLLDPRTVEPTAEPELVCAVATAWAAGADNG